MTLDQSSLLELTEVLRTADGGPVMRLMLSRCCRNKSMPRRPLTTAPTGYENIPIRTAQGSGTREKTVSTTAGDLMVKIPKLHAGSFFPSWLAPRLRIDVELNTVVMEAYVHSVHP